MSLSPSLATPVAPDIVVLTDDQFSSILLYGSLTYNDITNKIIIISTIYYIKIIGRFNKIEAWTQ